MRLAEVWRDGRRKLPEELRGRILQAIYHAAGGIYRGNVQAGYSNIAIMGGGLCAIAGELLHEKRMLEYGRRRLQAVADRTADHGALNEYNSPTYTMIALHETERMLSLLRDPSARASAEAIRVAAWEMLAAHFHPPTGPARWTARAAPTAIICHGSRWRNSEHGSAFRCARNAAPLRRQSGRA